MRVGLTACASCFAGQSTTSFSERGFKLLLVAWREGIALLIGAVSCFWQGGTTARDHPPVVPLWRHYSRQGSGFNSPWRDGGGTTPLGAPAVVKLLILLPSVGCGEQPHRPPRDPHRATHPRTRIHCPRVPVPCFPADFLFVPFVFGRRRTLERVAFLCRKGAELLPASILAPLALPSPPADPHGGGSLEPASADALALFAAALAALTRFCSRVRAGTILSEARTQRGPSTPLPPRRRPPHRAATTAPGPHPLSTPLPSLISPSPPISTLTTPSPLLCPRLSSSQPLSTPVQPRTRPHEGPHMMG